MLVDIIQKIIFLTVCGVLLADLCTTMVLSDLNKNRDSRSIRNCEQLPLKILKRVHGPAFDPRYMSIHEPLESGDQSDTSGVIDRKRNAENRPSFFISEENRLSSNEESAWKIQWDTFFESEGSQKTAAQSTPLRRQKRQNHNRGRTEPWRCEQRVKWMNLGTDYYPSHLKTVECTKPKCYYGNFDCKPKSFAVRLLKRRRGVCEDASIFEQYGFTGAYVEVWEWIDYPVNFCCDCVAPKHTQYF